MAALTGSPTTAMAITLLFGLTRGLAILLGVRLTEPERLRRFHQRFDELGPTVRWAVIVVQMVVAIVAAGAAWGALGAAGAAVVGGAAALSTRGGAPAAAARPAALLAER